MQFLQSSRVFISQVPRPTWEIHVSRETRLGVCGLPTLIRPYWHHKVKCEVVSHVACLVLWFYGQYRDKITSPGLQS